MINLFHRSHPGRPCKHMEPLLNRAADGSAKGLGKWYALAHAARCPGCREFLENLREMIETLRRGKTTPSPEAVKRLKAVIDKTRPES